MKIVRDGVEYTLTSNELYEAYRESEKLSIMEELRYQLENDESVDYEHTDLSKIDFDEVAEQCLEDLSNNDSYNEDWWNTIYEHYDESVLPYCKSIEEDVAMERKHRVISLD